MAAAQTVYIFIECDVYRGGWIKQVAASAEAEMDMSSTLFTITRMMNM